MEVSSPKEYYLIKGLLYWFAYRTESSNELSTLMETAGEEEEINKAAIFIQNKFRNYMSKKKSLDGSLSPKSLENSLENGSNGYGIDSGVSSLKSESL